MNILNSIFKFNLDGLLIDNEWDCTKPLIKYIMHGNTCWAFYIDDLKRLRKD